MPRYNPAEIEPRWQRYWEQSKTFRTPLMKRGGGNSIVLDMFPYPVANGLHVRPPGGIHRHGHRLPIQCMRGMAVFLHPMGFDAFGLPATITCTPLRRTRLLAFRPSGNIANLCRQLKMLGFSYDWDRQLATTDPDYFHWYPGGFSWCCMTTWFDESPKQGATYFRLPIPERRSSSCRKRGDTAITRPIPVGLPGRCRSSIGAQALGTVLANEEVIDGRSERGKPSVQRNSSAAMDAADYCLCRSPGKEIWTNYDWPDGIKKLQPRLDRPERGG